MLAQFFIVGAFLVVGADGKVRTDFEVAGEGFKTKSECEAQVAEFTKALDEVVKSGKLKGYVLECRKIEVEEPKAK